MCNGHSTRVSQGGSIAVLRPTSQFKRSQTDDDMLLFFSNRLRSQGTSIELQGWGQEVQLKKHWVVIHRDGDLSTPSTPQQEQPNPLYSFPLESNLEPVMQLPQRLDLGVSDVGIIGRRVSVMTGEGKEMLMVAEGIIGWN